MKLFLTGGTGFIGVPLARALRARGDEVTVYLRKDGELDDPSWADRLRGYDAVIHAAGAISYKESDRARLQRVNSDFAESLARSALRAGVKRFVHMSSIVAVGVGTRAGEVLDETAAYNAGPLKLGYFDSKHEGEQRVLGLVSQGLNAVIVNPGTVAGHPGESGPAGNVARSLNMLARLPFLLPGSGSWVDVSDVVAGTVSALDRGASGERYILTSMNLSNAELSDLLRDTRGKPRARIRFPRLPLRFGPQLARRLGCELRFSSEKARRELGYAPRDPRPAMLAMLTSDT